MATTLFQGTPVALTGEFIQKGAQAPDFSLVKGDLSTFSLADAKGKFVVLNIFPSMDTGVCAASVRKFNKLASSPAWIPEYALLLYVSSTNWQPEWKIRWYWLFQKTFRLHKDLVLAISKDLPFAQGRFCTAEGIEHVIPLSDFRYTSTFGKDYGVLMTDGPLCGLLARAVVILNPEGKVIYTQLVPEIVEEPDYDAALAALK